MGTEGRPAWGMVALLFISVAAGIAAQYFFYRKAGETISWQDFLRPLLASPLVFLPLLGAFQGNLSYVNHFDIGNLMILIIGFQNGFFWKKIFEREKDDVQKKNSDQ